MPRSQPLAGNALCKALRFPQRRTRKQNYGVPGQWDELGQAGEAGEEF
ncbi:hypothetical protein H6G96_02145 [Nostoc sp. FACHB-892]|nr:hypothetical protein [Nostoc sp. FACHB-892]MBD2725155.1 hypothetical protein [Nostoc sp. FACHB-892]